MYTATIQTVVLRDGCLHVDVLYENGDASFSHSYSYSRKEDIDAQFDETVEMEMKRLDDLEDAYKSMLPQVNTKRVWKAVEKCL